MQIIETTALGVRSAVLHLDSRDGGPSFVLFPVIHVAAPEFYAEIGRRLEDCEVILHEGVISRTGSLLTLSYRLLAENPPLELVAQNTMALDHLKDLLIHADVTGEAFERRWWNLKTWYRFAIPLFAPLLGLYLRRYGTRGGHRAVSGAEPAQVAPGDPGGQAQR